MNVTQEQTIRYSFTEVDGLDAFYVSVIGKPGGTGHLLIEGEGPVRSCYITGLGEKPFTEVLKSFKPSALVDRLDPFNILVSKVVPELLAQDVSALLEAQLAAGELTNEQYTMAMNNIGAIGQVSNLSGLSSQVPELMSLAYGQDWAFNARNTIMGMHPEYKRLVAQVELFLSYLKGDSSS